MTVVITIVDASLPSGPALSTHDHSPSASSAAPKSTIVPIASVPAPLDQCLVLNSATGMTALVDLCHHNWAAQGCSQHIQPPPAQRMAVRGSDRGMCWGKNGA